MQGSSLEPTRADVGGLLLTPGAGGGADHHTLLALEEGLDLAVRRVKVPQRAANNAALSFVTGQTQQLADDLGVPTKRLVVGGRSFGGRVCSLAVAEGLDVAGLLLLSYPLHPPGKPDKLRVDHFPSVPVPCLFVSGTRDPFGKPEEFAQQLGELAGPVSTHWIDGGAHAPKASSDDEIVGAVQDWLGGLTP